MSSIFQVYEHSSNKWLLKENLAIKNRNDVTACGHKLLLKTLYK